MKRVLVFTAIVMLVLLAACSGKQMEAKPLSSRAPTAAVVSEPAPAPEESNGKTAAQAIVELREQMQNAPVITTTPSPKEGSTGMPPAPAGLTGKDALAARTRALFSKSTSISEAVDAVTKFPDYSKESNLPEEYQQGGQYD
ncbi:MAG: hypothetical protein QXT19_03840 [Candidatus Woesearchaeota archaeon]